MKTRILSGLFLFAAISACPVFLKAEIHPPQLQIPMIKSAPAIDGKLNDKTWQHGTQLTEFLKWTLNEYIKDPVQVFVYYDDRNLYVAFRNSDPEAPELNKTVDPKGPRDSFLWGRNHASVAIRYRDVNVRMMADPKGTMTDWKNNDISWNGNWNYGSSINQTDWTAEFSIPLSEFGINSLSTSDTVELSVSRSYPLGESSAWSGKCILAGANTAIFSYGRWPEPVPGKNEITFSSQNQGKEPLNLHAELELIPLNEEPEFINQQGQGPSSEFQLKISSAPLYFKSDFSVPPGSTIEQNMGFEIPGEGSYYGTITIRSDKGNVLRRSSGYWFTLAPNKKNLEILREKTGESIAAMSRISNPVADNLKKEAEGFLDKVTTFQKEITLYWKPGKWNDLAEQIKKSTSRFQGICIR